MNPGIGTAVVLACAVVFGGCLLLGLLCFAVGLIYGDGKPVEFVRTGGILFPRGYYRVASWWKPKKPHRNPTRELMRAQRVEALLKARCPVCRAAPGTGCKKTKPYALLDHWGTACHFERMELAVTEGFAKKRDVLDQWDGKVPEGLRL